MNHLPKRPEGNQTMKIAVFGGKGRIGTAITAEAQARGHEVEVVSHRTDAAAGDTVTTGSLFDADLVAEVRGRNDATVISIPPSRTGGDHEELVEAHRTIAYGPVATPVLVVGGAGSLRTADGYLKDQNNFPERLRAEAETMTRILELYLNAPKWDWTICSPPPQITPGRRTGTYQLGSDSVVGPTISTEDFAVAVLDEIESPRHPAGRFTVADLSNPQGQ